MAKNFSATPSQPSRRWYQEPMVWMVIGGPLVVVVASLVTFGIAASRPDPVLDRAPPTQVDPAVLKAMSPEERESVEPAMKARNHVASPRAPADQ